jgi:cytochrome c oxidase cbb3-type subunit 1
MLTYVPVRGTLQAVVATWYAQNVFSLWLAPLAIGALYYLLPKISGRVIPAYDFAIYGFWSLVLFGTWMGARHLIGSPVPAWIATVAICSTCLVLFHHLITFFNLRAVFCANGSTTLKFAAIGFAAYLASGLIDAVFAVRGLAVITQFTYFQQAQAHLSFAAYSLIIIGALYYAVPRLTGVAWPSAALIRIHYLASFVGFLALIVGLALAGWTQGHDLNDASVTFAQIAVHTKTWLQLATAGQAVLLIGNALFALHFLRLLFTKPAASGSLFRQPATLEASVS